MKRTVLVTGKNTALGSKLIEGFLSEGYQVIATVKSEKDAAAPGEISDKNLVMLPWNRRSPLSARNVVLGGLNAFGAIDEAAILYTPAGDSRQLHELPAPVIEEMIDSQIKSQFFMLKEVLLHFEKERKGVLSLIMHTEGTDTLAPLDAMAMNSFEALANSVFTFYQNEPFIVNAFESGTTQAGAFAEHIRNTLKEQARTSGGKWYRYPEKSSFFGPLFGAFKKK